MRDGNTGAEATCQFEVGTPIKNQKQGWIIKRDAQKIAAAAANEAAYAVLSKTGGGAMIGPACREFIILFNEGLDAYIKGSHVRSTCDARLQPIYFGHVQ